jgi:hypothetical protein
MSLSNILVPNYDSIYYNFLSSSDLSNNQTIMQFYSGDLTQTGLTPTVVGTLPVLTNQNVTFLLYASGYCTSGTNVGNYFIQWYLVICFQLRGILGTPIVFASNFYSPISYANCGFNFSAEDNYAIIYSQPDATGSTWQKNYSIQILNTENFTS